MCLLGENSHETPKLNLKLTNDIFIGATGEIPKVSYPEGMWHYSNLLFNV